jgi:hypothetical protein
MNRRQLFLSPAKAALASVLGGSLFSASGRAQEGSLSLLRLAAADGALGRDGSTPPKSSG